MRDPLPEAGYLQGLTPAILVIGCGSADAGDDALGLVAAAALRRSLDRAPGVEIVEAGSPLALLDLLGDAGTAIVIDAVRTDEGRREPGTIVRAEVGGGDTPVDLRSSLSSHGLGVVEAVTLATALGRRSRVILYGIEASDVALGTGLSPPVRRALPALLRLLRAEVETSAEGVPSSGGLTPSSTSSRS